MARTAIVSSVSFDPQIFEKMETRRGKLRMQRSEYINRLIINDAAKRDATLEVSEVPDDVFNPPVVSRGKKAKK